MTYSILLREKILFWFPRWENMGVPYIRACTVTATADILRFSKPVLTSFLDFT
jgi:hypothetical protein